MKLYHYSKEPFSELKTVRYRKQLSKEEIENATRIMNFRQEIGLYFDHISFFFESIPVKNMGYFFRNVKHDFWFKGNKIFEHVIDSSTIGNFKFIIVESDEISKYNNTNWPDDPTVENKLKFFKERRKIEESLKLIGSNNHELETYSAKYTGKILSYYSNAYKTNDDESMLKYAASVPHVMIYPDSGHTNLLQTPVLKIIDNEKPNIKSMLKW